MWQEIATFQAFAVDEQGYFSNNKTFILPVDNIGLLGLLNSKIANFYFQKVCTKMVGGALAMPSIFVEGFPVHTDLDYGILNKLTNKRLNTGSISIEDEIDAYLAEVYQIELTDLA